MSLIEHNDLVQGSEGWLAARRGMVTASVVGKLVTPKTVKPANNDESRGLTALLVAERITGYSDPVWVTDDMIRGHEDEVRARDLYSLVRDEAGWKLGYSPDGVVGDDGLIEVKAPRSKKHLVTILSGEVPLEHMAQLQAGLLVTGREWIDYLSYSGGMPMWRKRVYADERWFDAITEAVTAFEATAAQMLADYETATVGLPATERVFELEIAL
jgi:hypothetical protein